MILKMLGFALAAVSLGLAAENPLKGKILSLHSSLVGEFYNGRVLFNRDNSRIVVMSTVTGPKKWKFLVSILDTGTGAVVYSNDSDYEDRSLHYEGRDPDTWLVLNEKTKAIEVRSRNDGTLVKVIEATGLVAFHATRPVMFSPDAESAYSLVPPQADYVGPWPRPGFPSGRNIAMIAALGAPQLQVKEYLHAKFYPSNADREAHFSGSHEDYVKSLLVPGAFPPSIFSIKLSPDATRLAILSQEYDTTVTNVSVWDLTTRKIIASITAPATSLNIQLRWLSDNQTIAGLKAGPTWLWNTQTHAVRVMETTNIDGISPDGRTGYQVIERVDGADFMQVVRYFDLATEKLLGTTQGKFQWNTEIPTPHVWPSFSDDSHFMAISSRDGSIRLAENQKPGP